MLDTTLRSVRARLTTIRSDIAAVTAPARGTRAAPYRPRTGDGWSAPRRPVSLVPATPEPADPPHLARVVEVERLTPDAVRIALEPWTTLDAGAAPGRFRAGQFLTVEVEIDGTLHRRPYSLCSDPADPTRLAIAVKRVEGGLVSNHLNDTVDVGDTLAVRGPSGRFGRTLDLASTAPLVLVAGGSGITPLLAILRAALAGGRGSVEPITLVYANRRLQDVMFRDALDALSAAHPELRLVHILESAPSDWAGPVGRIDAAALDAVAHEHAEWCVCGPGPMMDAVRAALDGLGVPEARIHEERFTAAPRPAGTDARLQQAHALAVRDVDGRVVTATVRPGVTLLEAGLSAGAPMPSSCRMGGCAACRCTLIEGAVEMDDPNCLTPGERARGEILSCVARPLTDVTVALTGDAEGSP